MNCTSLEEHFLSHKYQGDAHKNKQRTLVNFLIQFYPR